MVEVLVLQQVENVGCQQLMTKAGVEVAVEILEQDLFQQDLIGKEQNWGRKRWALMMQLPK